MIFRVKGGMAGLEGWLVNRSFGKMVKVELGIGGSRRRFVDWRCANVSKLESQSPGVALECLNDAMSFKDRCCF